MKRDDEEYVVGVVEEQFKYFGPFPAKIAEITDPETVQSIMLIMENIPKEKTRNLDIPKRRLTLNVPTAQT